MKTILSTFITCLLFVVANAQTEPDFRGFQWGASFEQVLSGEKAPFFFREGERLLEFRDNLAGNSCDVSYSFNENNKLVSGNYVFTKRYPNPQFYIEDYNTFKTLLVSKYGKPISEKELWAANTPMVEKHSYGQALADEHLKLVSTWTTNRSVIQIIAAGYEKHPAVYIHYMIKTPAELQDTSALKAAIKKL